METTNVINTLDANLLESAILFSGVLPLPLIEPTIVAKYNLKAGMKCPFTGLRLEEEFYPGMLPWEPDNGFPVKK